MDQHKVNLTGVAEYVAEMLEKKNIKSAIFALRDTADGVVSSANDEHVEDCQACQAAIKAAVVIAIGEEIIQEAVSELVERVEDLGVTMQSVENMAESLGYVLNQDEDDEEMPPPTVDESNQQEIGRRITLWLRSFHAENLCATIVDVAQRLVEGIETASQEEQWALENAVYDQIIKRMIRGGAYHILTENPDYDLDQVMKFNLYYENCLDGVVKDEDSNGD